MHGVQRTGVRFTLTNSADPARADEANAWYDQYAKAITRPGLLVNAFRFENREAAGTVDDPRFAAIYDIAAADPADAWPATERSPDYPKALFDDPRSALVVPALRGSYALVGSRAREGGHGPLTGVYILLSDGAGDTARAEWAADQLAHGTFYAAARFRLIEGFPRPAEWLEIFETDSPVPAPPQEPAAAIRRRHAGLFHPVERKN